MIFDAGAGLHVCRVQFADSRQSLLAKRSTTRCRAPLSTLAQGLIQPRSGEYVEFALDDDHGRLADWPKHLETEQRPLIQCCLPDGQKTAEDPAAACDRLPFLGSILARSRRPH